MVSFLLHYHSSCPVTCRYPFTSSHRFSLPHQTLVKEAVVHPLEVEPGQFLPQTEQAVAAPTPPPLPAPSPPPLPASLQQTPLAPQNPPGRAHISLAISVGPAPVHPSAVVRSNLMPRPPTLEDGMRGREGWKERSDDGRERWGMAKERARGRLSQQKERKATQMLAIVLGEQGEVLLRGRAQHF